MRAMRGDAHADSDVDVPAKRALAHAGIEREKERGLVRLSSWASAAGGSCSYAALRHSCADILLCL